MQALELKRLTVLCSWWQVAESLLSKQTILRLSDPAGQLAFYVLRERRGGSSKHSTTAEHKAVRLACKVGPKGVRKRLWGGGEGRGGWRKCAWRARWGERTPGKGRVDGDGSCQHYAWRARWGETERGNGQ